jgi:hypothetical protein
MIGLKKFDYLQVWVQITCRSILVMLYPAVSTGFRFPIWDITLNEYGRSTHSPNSNIDLLFLVMRYCPHLYLQHSHCSYLQILTVHSLEIILVYPPP